MEYTFKQNPSYSYEIESKLIILTKVMLVVLASCGVRVDMIGLLSYFLDMMARIFINSDSK